MTEIQLINEKRLDRIMADIRAEFIRATGLYPSHSSTHESMGVLREEFDELWDQVKSSHVGKVLEAEAIQVGAMAVRFIHDEGERRDVFFEVIQ